ncbi:complex I NDUFA9 subunit family protein [Halorubellus sp. JP-L1]|uniref:complex I NDUFA9 subunit family protein n=1 Tax=Halorubellus sp. JP-L1 TaxID=2715753 RepID=UPI001409C22B|nr:complex I NDUFA9 subunit family protein [Halorubellus sp. JP-L1]NHN41502.1 complex I NDUFA9 subunit family protein [Halorubellus sp. JP-L1]
MRVIVAGGTGYVGRHVCTELADRGHDVTALARSPDDADLPDVVDTAMGDVTAYDSIEPHFEGMDAAVNLVALSPLFKPPKNLTHDLVHTQGTRNVVDACEHHGVEHLVQQSALGADPNGLTSYIRSKGEAERIVRDSDLAWTILRPSVIFGEGGEFVEFTKQLTTGVVAPLPAGGTNEFQPIWIEDFAPLVVDAIEDDTHRGEIYEIGGPEVLTMREVTELAWAAEGKHPKMVTLPMWFMRTGLTVAGPVPFFPFGPEQAKALKIQNTVDENDVTAFGVDPAEMRTLADYLGVDADAGRPEAAAA